MSQIVLTARWILPVASPPMENGRVVIEHGRIADILQDAPHQAADVDYGDAVILPGLVNAHTHLELTEFHGRAPFDGSFTGWLQRVVAQQMQPDAEQAMRRGIREGIDRSLTAGVTTVIDTGCAQWPVDAWQRPPVNLVGLLEVLGMGPRAHGGHPRAMEYAAEALRLVEPEIDRGLLRLGISPHAPYSTAAEVYRAAIACAQRQSLPICTHLAETREELEFVAHGTGPFRELLEARGLWDASCRPPGCSPVQYAEQLGLLSCKPLLAHVNYVEPDDMDLLARRECSVAYCPRTHEFFRHAPHPYRDMLSRGVNVCLGTDSLASTDSLSILDELRFLRRMDDQTDSAVLLAMATLHGARAAGLASQVGSLEPGKQADCLVVPLGNAATTHAADDLLESDRPPAAVWVKGHQVFTSAGSPA